MHCSLLQPFCRETRAEDMGCVSAGLRHLTRIPAIFTIRAEDQGGTVARSSEEKNASVFFFCDSLHDPWLGT